MTSNSNCARPPKSSTLQRFSVILAVSVDCPATEQFADGVYAKGLVASLLLWQAHNSSQTPGAYKHSHMVSQGGIVRQMHNFLQRPVGQRRQQPLMYPLYCAAFPFFPLATVTPTTQQMIKAVVDVALASLPRFHWPIPWIEFISIGSIFPLRLSTGSGSFIFLNGKIPWRSRRLLRRQTHQTIILSPPGKVTFQFHFSNCPPRLLPFLAIL